jgi:uncharacterized membrane protein
LKYDFAVFWDWMAFAMRWLRVITAIAWIAVDDLKNGRTADPKYGKIAKLRSTHNNYLTLPVVFLMLSNHYPLAFATQYNWIIAALVFLMGVAIRHYFNTRHARTGNPNLDLAGHRAAVYRDHLAVDGTDVQNTGRGRGAATDVLRTTLCSRGWVRRSA